MDTQGKSNSRERQTKTVVSEKRGVRSRVFFSYIPEPIHFKIANSLGAKTVYNSSLYSYVTHLGYIVNIFKCQKNRR